MEQWTVCRTPTDVFPHYEVSTEGRIRNTSNGKFLKTWRLSEKKRYHCVKLQVDGRSKPFSLHRLVASSFLGLTKEMTVHHKDHNPENNRVDNLECIPLAENLSRQKLHKLTHWVGNPMITEDMGMKIKQLLESAEE